MFGCLRYIQALREVDGLCFKNKAKIRIRLFGIRPFPFGRPSYKHEAKIMGQPVGKEYYTVPVFFREYSGQDLYWLATHEVRHRIQWNHPEMRLLTTENVPSGASEVLWKRIRNIQNSTHLNGPLKSQAREIDAHIIEYLAPPLLAKSKPAFLELMFGEVGSSKES